MHASINYVKSAGLPIAPGLINGRGAQAAAALCKGVHLQGSAAWSLCTTAHLLYTRFATIFGASISEATMRPNPRCRCRP